MQDTIYSQKTERPADNIETTLRSVAQNILVAVFGLLPIFFIPVTYVPLEYAKTIVVIIGSLIAVIFFSLSVLRSGIIKLTSPLLLVAFWGVALVAVLSAVLSGDLRDSLVGDLLGVHTAVFLLLMALTSTMIVLFGQSKESVLRLYMLLSGSAVVLTIYHVVRIFFGPDTLSLGLFGSSVSSPIGGWNQLGLFFGLVILLALVALEQLPLTKWGKWAFSFVILLSLLMLAVVNFIAVWVILSLVSLVMLMYSLTKDRFAAEAGAVVKSSTSSVQSVIVSATVFIASLVFIMGGSTVGTAISEMTGVNFVEVRPSFEATVDVARDVYKENAFVGVGPNKFSDAWRQYKDQAINQTVFWNTDFTAGSGYVPTFFVTTGIFGVIAFLTFVFFWFKAGLRMLLAAQTSDRFWYFIATSSFVAATYLWGMSFIYVTGTTMLLLAALFTGIVCVAYTSIIPTRAFTISVFNNRRSGIVLVGVVMILIVASASAMYYTTRHYSSVATFNKALQSVAPGTSIELVEQKIAEAYGVYNNDLYAREIAQYQIAKMNTLLSLSSPTAEQQQQFQQAAANGINAINLALQNDITDPRNHLTQGTLYGILAAAGVSDVSDKALSAFAAARQYDPVNPVYNLLEAQIKTRTGDIEGARESVLKAIELKPNYTDALFLLTQIDIAAGRVNDAILATETIVSLERNNPARYYQLGVLYSSAGRVDDAISAFERAVQLDNGYANARYFLALAYVEKGRDEEAIAQLEVVHDLNPENTAVQTAIDQIKAGTINTGFGQISEQPVSDSTLDSQADLTDEDLESSLVSPVNVVPEETEEVVESTDNEEVTPEVTEEKLDSEEVTE